jgi:uncharacterized protein
VRLGLFLAALLAAASPVFPFPFSLLPCPFSLSAAAPQPPPPLLTGPVHDFANVIDSNNERELERLVQTLRSATGDVIVIATVPTFQPYATIDEYTVKMFENGGKGIGERGHDNGLLIVLAVEDRKVRIEPGYGLEGFITDGFAGQTIREQMLPAFRTGQYGRGLVAGTTRLVHRIAEQRRVSLPNLPPPAAPAAETRRAPSDGDFPGALVFIVLLLVFMLLTRRRRRRRRYWGGGPWSGWNSGVGPFGGGFGGFGGGFGGFGGRGGGGGFGGFSGGRSGGGGASGGW